MTISYTLQFTAKPGRAEDFAQFIAHMIGVVKANDVGCLQYELYRSLGDPDRFAFVETWASQADIDAHMEKPHIKEFAKMNEMLVGPPVMAKHSEPAPTPAN